MDKKNKAVRSLGEALEFNGGILTLNESEKSLYEFFSKKYQKFKWEHNLDYTQYDFLITGAALSVNRDKVLLISNNSRLARLYLLMIGDNLIKPKKLRFYNRRDIDSFEQIPLR